MIDVPAIPAAALIEKTLVSTPETLSLNVTVKSTLVALEVTAPAGTIVTVGEVLSTVYAAPPVNAAASALPAASTIVPFAATSRRTVPSPVPLLTVTLYVVPLPVTLVIEVPATPEVVSEKSPASTPVTLSLNVTV